MKTQLIQSVYSARTLFKIYKENYLINIDETSFLARCLNATIAGRQKELQAQLLIELHLEHEV